MPDEPFFRRTDAGFEPTSIATGPWGPTTVHGRVVAGLLAREVEQTWGGEDLRVARMTVDLYRMPGFAPAQVTSKAARDGHRIKVIDAEYLNGEMSIGRASFSFLRKSENPEGEVWGPPDWDAPLPGEIPPPEAPPGRPDWRPMWETRNIMGGFGTVGRKRCWIRELHRLVDDEPLTPLQRVALAADFTSPYANSGSTGLQYLNTDITLYIHRYPAGEWIGFETASHHAHEGIAVAECVLYDEEGAIGRSITAAIANRRQA